MVFVEESLVPDNFHNYSEVELVIITEYHFGVFIGKKVSQKVFRVSPKMQ